MEFGMCAYSQERPVGLVPFTRYVPGCRPASRSSRPWRQLDDPNEAALSFSATRCAWDLRAAVTGFVCPLQCLSVHALLQHQ